MNLLELPDEMLCLIYKKCDHLTRIRCMKINKRIETIVRREGVHKRKLNYLSIDSSYYSRVNVEFQYVNSDERITSTRSYHGDVTSFDYISQILKNVKFTKSIKLSNINITDELLELLKNEKCIQKNADLYFAFCGFCVKDKRLFDQFIQMIEPSCLRMHDFISNLPYKFAVESLLAVTNAIYYNGYDRSNLNHGSMRMNPFVFHDNAYDWFGVDHGSRTNPFDMRGLRNPFLESHLNKDRSIPFDMTYLKDSFLESYLSKNRSINFIECETGFTLRKILDLCKANSLFYATSTIQCDFGILKDHTNEEIINILTANGFTYESTNQEGIKKFTVTLQKDPWHEFIFKCRHAVPEDNMHAIQRNFDRRGRFWN